MSKSTSLNSNFQVTIPEELLAQLGWKPGQELAFVPKGRGVLVMPMPEREDIAGIAKGANPEGYRDRNDRY